MNKITAIIAILVLLMLPMVLADSASLNTPLSSTDKATFDQILAPVMKIYNFIKYIASIIAGIALLWAGVTYMMSGSDPKKREDAKNIATYVVIGLIIIWGAPLIVQLFV